MGKALLAEQSVATEGTSFLPSSLSSFLPLSLPLPSSEGWSLRQG